MRVMDAEIAKFSNKAKEIIAQMSLEEKVALMSGDRSLSQKAGRRSKYDQ